MKDIYTREMLNHDYSDEAYLYKEAGMTEKEIANDIKEVFKDYELEDDEIVNDYIENILAAM